ncbi:FAS-associated factor 1 [Cotesia glomerata]|uniref:FAS-associated factor 1 n=1 Tax=Cotesia glomerata TaxID=32391 RepID=UPI001D00603D|nr:FAS-associated factor 1 [Cotesia glomerata]XP_044589998.1 FAS-associated factor 1 [Cotesia glomerata]XP_044589999.1 FAS-associated factor 1 [Cotesia glomerata]XP_044590000.1 FAS-associated factor 1 [Cotesia glomerata]XP_044590001.1 FAS-associated factor 1 [Cotesia glomerata]XP_044590002.1 FAS-associated factor 1 [Cotesia glomerata]XP_044590003.1 FAS-associated factor 1 [Cotesia glomerata]XP_044590004.1 FAS-associated factor 1 [Cotesia glomerata]XP_044590005.1 FAS-associated factor 1 [Cot
MSENREVILADFQACSGIDDVGEAIMHLESNNWDLLMALNAVMNHDSQQLPSEINPDVEMVEVVEGVPTVTFSSSDTTSPTKDSTASKEKSENPKPGTSHIEVSEVPKILTFYVHYLNAVYKINLSELCTLRDLKYAIFEKTKVGPCEQEINGWKKAPLGNSSLLKSLELVQDNTLFITSKVKTGDSCLEASYLSDRLTRTYILNVRDDVHGKTYNLKYPGTHTILDVKTGVYTLTDVPVRNQKWKGWPNSVKDDEITLAQSGIAFPEHDLSVSQTLVKEKKDEDLVIVESDSSADEAEDAEEFEDVPESFIIEDDIFIDNILPTKFQRLIPENVEDETMGTLHFSEQFEKRYGLIHPEFFTGTFDEAIRESCLKSPKERKLLAVYLHHDNSVLTNVFCTQLLGCETILQLLSANFVVWGWDFTYESNKQKFLSSFTQSLGIVGSEAVRNIDVDTLPVFIILMRSRSTTEIFTIVHGNVGVNELLTNLIHAVDIFQEQKRVDVEAEKERQAREKVKQEQDQAYQESLAADRAKEEAKQIQQQLEQKKKEQAENTRLVEEAKKEAHRQAVQLSLPPEPDEESGNHILKVKIRLPGGKFLERKFRPDTPLQILLNFLIVEGYPTDEYKVISSWPRRDLTSLDTSLTLSELKFCLQETVILEER